MPNNIKINIDWHDIRKRAVKIYRFFAHPTAASILILAICIFILAGSLTNFTLELARIRRTVPGTLNRIEDELDRVDQQISAVNKMMKGYEAAGKDFSTGLNKGISSGIIEIPVGAVSNVGEKIKDTAVSTGKTGYGFWTGVKEKLMFWQKKKTVPTPEASPEK